MKKLAAVLFTIIAVTAYAQPSVPAAQKLSEAQKAFGAGDCTRAQALLHDVVAADPQNFVAHVLAAHCFVRQKDYPAAIAEFQRTLVIRPDAQQGVLGLIQSYALARDFARRDAAIAHLRTLVNGGKIAPTARFVREQFAAGDTTVVANEYATLGLLRTLYAFDVLDAQGKPVRMFELTSRELDQPRTPPATIRRFALESTDAAGGAAETIRVYESGEPSYEQVVADVKAALAHQPLRPRDYERAALPAIVEPFPITRNDASDPRMKLRRGEVAIEFIAHSCFRIHTANGTRILIDPYASRMWIGYDFPSHIAADEVLITHPHYDHDADVLLGGKPAPWSPDVPALRDHGTHKLGGVTTTGIRGRHADPWGKEFGQTNTIWLIDAYGLRIAHLGDNGPLTDSNVRELGRVDVLLMPIDARHHILTDAAVDAIREALHPRIVIPMHYRLPDLETSAGTPEGLGEITPWLAAQPHVERLNTSILRVSRKSLPRTETVIVLQHSPKVSAALRE